MHNEYIKLSCIRDVNDKLFLIKCKNNEIREIRKVLYELTLDLMNKSYNHVNNFKNELKSNNTQELDNILSNYKQ